MSELEHALLSEVLQWYRLQRHDFLNHWQVIMGNLQLGQPQKALTYMREMMAVPQLEQKIAQIPQSELSAILLSLIIHLRQIEISATIDFPEEMTREVFWQDHWREEYTEALYGYTRECMEVASQSNQSKDLDAEVYLFDEPGGLACQFILLDEENVLFDKMLRVI